MILEVCAFNIQSCLVAQQAGAARVELCADPLEGGTTPSFGLIEYALEHATIPVFPMIRPRGGSYVFDKHEVSILQKDILKCRDMGCTGIATGGQTEGRLVDAELMKRIVDWAYPMAVTCHKVFDEAPDPFAALESLIAAGCSRVLTSGTARTATEGAAILARLVEQAAGRIVVMPGGSIRAANISALAVATGAAEYHSSGVLSRGSVNFSDMEEVRHMVLALRAIKDDPRAS